MRIVKGAPGRAARRVGGIRFLWPGGLVCKVIVHSGNDLSICKDIVHSGDLSSQ